MLNFTVYNLELIRQQLEANGQTVLDLFQPEKTYTPEEALTEFGNFFTGKLDLSFEKDDVAYSHEIVRVQDNVIVLRIANNKVIHQETNFKTKELEHHPSLVVIIDNRHDCQRIAIQKCASAFARTSQVAAIMEETFKKIFAKFGFDVKISGKYYANDVWNFLEDMQKKNIPLTQMEMAFATPDNQPSMTALVDQFIYMEAKETGGMPVHIFRAPEGCVLNVRKTDFMMQLVRHTAGTGRPILFRVRGTSTVYRCQAEEVPADQIETVGSLVEESLSEFALEDLETNDLFNNESKWEKIVEFINRIKLIY